MIIHETSASVEQVIPLTDTVLQLMLLPEHYVDYEAGQYLQLRVGDVEMPYSIANAPLGAHHYELHIRHGRGNANALLQQLLDGIKHNGRVYLRAPFGVCHLGNLDPLKPILFIAAGTGFAPVKAMIEGLLAQGLPRPLELIWGARAQNDLYLDDTVNKWQNHVYQFQFTPLLSQVNHQTLASVARARHPSDLHEWQIVISGPFDLVYRTRDELVNGGVSPDNLHSDAFQFEDKL